MNFVAIIFVAFLAINSGPSSALTRNTNSLSRKSYTAEELGTCPMNSSISVKVFRNLKGEWLTTFVASNKLGDLTRSLDLHLKKNVLECADSRYITISGFIKDTEAGNFSEATVGDYRNNTDGEAYDSCKRMNEFTTIAEDIANQTRRAQQIVEQRMNSFEKTLNNITETLISFQKARNNITETFKSLEKTQTSFQKSQTSFQITLTNIEQVLFEMRGILNTTKNLDTEDKENATSKPSPLNTMSSCTEVKEKITTCPPCPVITKAKAQMTFDREYKGKKMQISSDLRTATRTRPTSYAYYGSVVSNSLLEEDEVFQIRIDETINEWSYWGIGIGVMKEKKEGIQDETDIITNFKGTWAIYSDARSQSGKSHTWKDGDVISENGYPLPTNYHPVGTLLAVSRRSNGNLHFYLNGVDKGLAFRNVPKDVYAFVEVIHYVSKISITN